jgi:hypothetical protein
MHTFAKVVVHETTDNPRIYENIILKHLYLCVFF